MGTIALDRHFDYSAVPASLVGDPEAATAILETVATSMVSLTALVLTVTMVVVQLAMGQFSPRIVQRVLQDKPSQLAVGLFVATFVHAILALREVKSGGDGDGQVPGIAVMTAFVLVLVSIAVLVIYVHHIGRSLRVAALIELVEKETRELIDRTYPESSSSPSDPHLIVAVCSGVIASIDDDALVEQARRADCRVELLAGLGEYVIADAPLFRIHGDPQRLDHARMREALMLELERVLEYDVAYGLRLLVDIAQRSIADSPLQDPTTTVQAIDRLHDILRQLARREFPSGEHRDAAGHVRLSTKTMSWDGYVRLAFEEIRLAGAARSPQVARRLRAALVDLRSIVTADRAAVLDEQLAQLDAAIAELTDAHDAQVARGEDPQGIGPAAGYLTRSGEPEGTHDLHER